MSLPSEELDLKTCIGIGRFRVLIPALTLTSYVAVGKAQLTRVSLSELLSKMQIEILTR